MVRWIIVGPEPWASINIPEILLYIYRFAEILGELGSNSRDFLEPMPGMCCLQISKESIHETDVCGQIRSSVVPVAGCVTEQKTWPPKRF